MTMRNCPGFSVLDGLADGDEVSEVGDDVGVVLPVGLHCVEASRPD